MTTVDCPTCYGAGVIVTNPEAAWSGLAQILHDEPCGTCDGTGQIPAIAVEAPHEAEIDDQTRATAQAAAASIRSLIDPMSGRIDNWSER